MPPHPRYVCVHGHFYQPPRENPWLEAIELQESAYPYHDWNERITAECYAPNARCRMLDGDRRIARIVNNYARISFNFGPTLLSWLEAHDPPTYAAVREADRLAVRKFGGHGSALAQVYNHAILPLCNDRDKLTQVRWGIADFRRRFGRDPEGMWLAETAADVDSLEVLAAHGIRFTVLSPYQAKRVRFLGEDDDDWQDVDGGRVDPTRPYECRLPSGRSITLFFYDGPISQGIAFEKLLNRGEDFAGRLLGAFHDDRDWPQLVHVATDGETYGHHHTYGDMALAYALDALEAAPGIRLTNYGQYLELHPPTHEVQIHEPSAWSCSHGVERWNSNCGCCSGGKPGWNQAWRTPLRLALDWLRDRVAPLFEQKAGRFWADPWAARDAYIDLVLDRSEDSRRRLFRRLATPELTPGQETTALKLLELQRHLLLMYTSCGWFFDDLSGIETVQVIQYAARAIQLAEDLFAQPFEEDFLARLALAQSNVPEHGDGRRVYEKFVRPARVDLPKVAAHYAVSSLFEEYPQEARLFCYRAEADDLHTVELGKARLAIGRARVTSELTLESAEFGLASVHFGDHNLHGGVRPYTDSRAHVTLKAELEEAFGRADFPAVIRTLDAHFQAGTYSLRSLFRDEQRKVLARLLDSTAVSMESEFRQIYEQHALMMRFLLGLDAPLPQPWVQATAYTLNTDLRRALAADDPDPERVRQLLDEARTWRVALDQAGLAFTIRSTAARLTERVRKSAGDVALLERLTALLELVRGLPFEVDCWRAQNLYDEMFLPLVEEQTARYRSGDAEAASWLRAFARLGDRLNFRVRLVDAEGD